MLNIFVSFLSFFYILFSFYSPSFSDCLSLSCSLLLSRSIVRGGRGAAETRRRPAQPPPYCTRGAQPHFVTIHFKYIETCKNSLLNYTKLKASKTRVEYRENLKFNLTFFKFQRKLKICIKKILRNN